MPLAKELIAVFAKIEGIVTVGQVKGTAGASWAAVAIEEEMKGREVSTLLYAIQVWGHRRGHDEGGGQVRDPEEPTISEREITGGSEEMTETTPDASSTSTHEVDYATGRVAYV